jgi:hypothetical protein
LRETVASCKSFYVVNAAFGGCQSVSERTVMISIALDIPMFCEISLSLVDATLSSSPFPRLNLICGV